MDGQIVDTVDDYFSHPRPFYDSWWAWVIYLMLLCGLAYLLVQYRTRQTQEELHRQYEDMRQQQDFKVLASPRVSTLSISSSTASDSRHHEWRSWGYIMFGDHIAYN